MHTRHGILLATLGIIALAPGLVLAKGKHAAAASSATVRLEAKESAAGGGGGGRATGRPPPVFCCADLTSFAPSPPVPASASPRVARLQRASRSPRCCRRDRSRFRSGRPRTCPPAAPSPSRQL